MHIPWTLFGLSTLHSDILIVRRFGLQPWSLVSLTMHQFTDRRHENTPDEIWLVEHEPVFTQGQAGKSEHLLMPGEIPVMQSDRGGQVTYHGPGQQMMYVLVNLRRRRVGVRQLVTAIEQTVIDTLAELSVSANARLDAPGVYVDGKKICSLGLRIRNGCSLHGLALNVAMDLAPFLRINPCGYAGLEMTQLTAYQPSIKPADIQPLLIKYFARQLEISNINWSVGDLTISE